MCSEIVSWVFVDIWEWKEYKKSFEMRLTSQRYKSGISNHFFQSPVVRPLLKVFLPGVCKCRQKALGNCHALIHFATGSLGSHFPSPTRIMIPKKSSNLDSSGLGFLSLGILYLLDQVVSCASSDV